jgi:hypothetical protein
MVLRKALRFLLALSFVMLLDAAAGARPQQAGALRPSALSGTVSEGATGRALGGVVVALVSGNERVSVRAITDSKGRFVFRDLPASDDYEIQATKAGYVASGLVQSILPLAGSRLPLGEGEWISDANFVMWRLGGISGTVVDERGEPVVDVPVRVLIRIAVAGAMQLAAGPVAKTDDRGVYRIAGLGRGDYIVTVPSVLSTVPPSTPAATVAGLSLTTAASLREPPKVAGLDIGGSWLVIGQYATPPPVGGTQQAYPIVFYPNARSVAGATPVDLADGEEKHNIDFALQPVPTARISGRVTGPADAIAGMVLRLLPEGSETLGGGSEQATALVDSDGGFAFIGVPAGRYTIDARSSVSELAVRGTPIGGGLPSTPGMISEGSTFMAIPSAPRGTMFQTRYTTDREAYSARFDVTVGSDDVLNVIVALQRGGTISGKIVQEGGRRLPSTVSVWVEPASGNPELGPRARLGEPGSPPAGEFAIQGLQQGQYFLRVLAGAGLVVKSIAAGGGDYTDRPFEAVPGTDITDVVVTLTDKAGTLSGAVRDRHGTAVREAAIILFPADHTLWTRFGLRPPRIQAVTCFGSQGYQIRRLPQGDYDVIAVDVARMDAWRDPRFFASAAPLATRVTLEWGGSKVQDLTLSEVTIK